MKTYEVKMTVVLSDDSDNVTKWMEFVINEVLDDGEMLTDISAKLVENSTNLVENEEIYE